MPLWILLQGIEDLVKVKMKKIVLATGNKDKIKEINDLLTGTNIEAIPVSDVFNPEETGTTFEENAYIKAFEAAKIHKIPALADDSGLVVDALNGAPGIYSSRYAQDTASRIKRVLDEMKDVPYEKRTARFVCSMVVVDPEGNILKSCTGKCEGKIITELRGEQGFGYDPIFFIPELNRTMAELTMEEKNRISHRSNALRCILDWIRTCQ